MGQNIILGHSTAFPVNMKNMADIVFAAYTLGNITTALTQLYTQPLGGGDGGAAAAMCFPHYCMTFPAIALTRIICMRDLYTAARTTSVFFAVAVTSHRRRSSEKQHSLPIVTFFTNFYSAPIERSLC